MTSRQTLVGPAIPWMAMLLSTSLIVSASALVDDAGVTLAMVAGHHRPVVQLEINGRGPYSFFVDTGAGGSVVTSRRAQELGLAKVGTMQAVNPTDGIVREVHQVVAESVTAGGLTLRDLSMMALDMPQLQDLDGVLAVTDLPVSRVTFDFPKRELRLDGGGLQPGPRVMTYAPSPVVSVTALVAGNELVMHLDTGSRYGITLPGALARDLDFSEELTVIREQGPLVVRQGRLQGEVEIGALKLADPVVEVIDLFPGFGNIGSAFLADKVLTLDLQHHLLQIVPAEF